MIHLENETLRLGLMPDHGAAIWQMEFRTASGWQPVLVPGAAEPRGALSSGLFWMLPFANRARGNRLHDIRLQPNTAEPLALHGCAWQRRWQAEMQGAGSVRLHLAAADAGSPFPFSAKLDLRVDGSSFLALLVLRNEGAQSIPAGLGAHPWFPNLPGTELQFDASHVYLEGPDHLPTDPITPPPELDFSAGAPVPKSWRNNAYAGWRGQAVIRQPELGYQLTMHTAPVTRELMFHTAPDLPRFALEPQTHTSGATLADPPAPQVGLVCLEPGEVLACGLTLTML
ncbi:aldose epimerase family protein [Paracoccus zhejiangensis]|uniref:Aldose 1-epimerase n=1 Tax=Paracoccus zhejiangensis TaxID=1077935 RepID=A0A2H5F135_9RHOB|nr:hypothetical protein [Paracoccus zhejiangensis]AUH65268.1 hypothetical protein CX676_14765 [Paracoccus zhejiangensis]